MKRIFVFYVLLALVLCISCETEGVKPLKKKIEKKRDEPSEPGVPPTPFAIKNC